MPSQETTKNLFFQGKVGNWKKSLENLKVQSERVLKASAYQSPLCSWVSVQDKKPWFAWDCNAEPNVAKHEM